MHKYIFRTPSNEKIEVDSRVYSLYRDIITIEDLKFLFTSKERLYSMDTFELAFFNKDTKEKEILNHDVKLCDLQIGEYLVIHLHVPKKTIFVDEKVELKPIDEEKVVEKVEQVEEKVEEKVEEQVEEKVEEQVKEKVETVVEEKVETVVEEVKGPVLIKVDEEEKVVEKKFCLIC